MKKYAAIDIGTNSMRLLLATIKDGKITERKKYMNTTRIGSFVDKNKMISKEGIEKNVEAFCEFVQKAKEYEAEEIPAIATSAVREARNKEEFVQAIYQRTGIDIKIISGEEEAELGYKGVIMGIQGHSGDDSLCVAGDTQKPSPCVPLCILVIDIGGGSTELILGEDSTLKKVLSLDIGAVRMTEKFIATDPVNKKEYEEMETLIYKTIERAKQGIMEQWRHRTQRDSSFCVASDTQEPSLLCPDTDRTNGVHEGARFSTLTAVGIGGTITTLAALHQELDPYDPEKTHNYKLTSENINDLKEKLLSITVRQIKQLKGIHPKRADIIVAGITILSVIMYTLNLKEIIVSEYDNLEGIIFNDSLMIV